MNYEVISSPIYCLGDIPGEGSFGRNEDRKKLGIVLKTFLKNFIKDHLRNGDFEGYRMYLNLQDWYLRGFPPSEPWTCCSKDQLPAPCCFCVLPRIPFAFCQLGAPSPTRACDSFTRTASRA